MTRGGRHRRARRRWQIQTIRDLVRRGVCPSDDARIEDRWATHLPTCPWSDPDYPEDSCPF